MAVVRSIICIVELRVAFKHRKVQRVQRMPYQNGLRVFKAPRSSRTCDLRAPVRRDVIGFEKNTVVKQALQAFTDEWRTFEVIFEGAYPGLKVLGTEFTEKHGTNHGAIQVWVSEPYGISLYHRV